MSRFYIAPESIDKNRIIVRGDEFHHIVDVMRLKAGDEIEAFDGEGNVFKGLIEHLTAKEVIIKVLEKRRSFSNVNFSIALAQAVPKKNKMDEIVEKCTELGIDEIIPIITERTIVNLEGDKAEARVSRWRKIAKEAAKQCGRIEITEVLSIMNFKDVLRKVKEFDLVFIPCLSGERVKIKEILKSFNGKRILFFIGPEGDFTKSEIELAKDSGVVPCDLGENVLKVETAAISTLAVIRYELNGG